LTIPKEAQVWDCKGKFIYPSFIDAYTDYGTPPPAPAGRFSYGGPAQLATTQKGPYGWNQAIKSDVDAAKVFSVDDNKAKGLR
jgi:hypothetical protein